MKDRRYQALDPVGLGLPRQGSAIAHVEDDLLSQGVQPLEAAVAGPYYSGLAEHSLGLLSRLLELPADDLDEHLLYLDFHLWPAELE